MHLFGKGKIFPGALFFFTKLQESDTALKGCFYAAEKLLFRKPAAIGYEIKTGIKCFQSTTVIIADIERLRGMISDLEYENKKIRYKLDELNRRLYEVEKRGYEQR